MKIESKSIDVIVLGGGISGIFAALAAKQDGINVVIIEPQNVLGGQGTSGGVSGFCGDTKLVNDSFAELIANLGKHDLIDSYNPQADQRDYNLEHCAFFLQELVLGKKIDILFHYRAIDVKASKGKITSVRVAHGIDMIEYKPQMVIDATGECCIAVAAGFPVTHEGALKQLPMSLSFTLLNTKHKVKAFLPNDFPEWKDDYDIPMTTVYEYPSGKIEVKMKVVGFDAAKGQSLSDAEIYARRQMMALIYHLQTKGYRGKIYDHHTLCSVSRSIGIREGRRIIGEYILTENDVTHGAVFEDAVAVGTYHLDYHWPDKPERAGTGICTVVEPYHIPLRSLIPKGAKNLLVPGRGASGDQMALSSFRVMATCAQMGFAAGKTALECIKSKCLLSEVSIKKVQKAVISEGQQLDLSNYGEYMRQTINTHEHVFNNHKLFGQCHASSLIQTSNNKTLVAWFGGTEEGHKDTAIWLSERYQCNWSKPRQIVKIRESAHWNPVLFKAPDGLIYLFFKVGDTIPKWETWLMTSSDEGQTWSEPRELVKGDKGGRGPVKNKIIMLSNGTWLAPASIETEKKWSVFIDRSEDNGQTWDSTGNIPLKDSNFKGEGVIQPSLWESKSGHVHMLIRSTCGYICRSDSMDFGRTWSKIYKTKLPNNNSGIDVAKLYDGTLALVYNPISKEGLISKEALKARSPLAISLSFDNGKTWPRYLELETEKGEYSYPAIIPTSVGMAVTYTWKRKSIVYWMGSMERIPKIENSIEVV